MKATYSYLAFATLGLTFSAQAALPTGKIFVDKALVREGVKPDITWKVNFPVSTVEELVKITPGGDITTKKKVKVDFYMLGTAVSNHRESTITYCSAADSGWKLVYSGYGKDINTSKSAFTKTVSSGATIKVASICDGKAPGWVYNNTPNALVMKKGDTPNSKSGWGGDASMEDYIRPYMKDGKIDIGPNDLMIALELTHTQAYKNDSGYDSNDSIVLVRFTEVN